MKNIHILPTDKPSNLHFTEFKELVFTPKYEKLDGVNIYITSDEEIKDGDWCITAKGNLLQMIEGDTVLGFALLGCKKIILTTDQDLIKDGVQAIDDDFLEWFVKNPSCEWVDVWLMNKGYNKQEDYPYQEHYLIIIPKEEPKPNSFCETPEEKCTMNYCDENGCQNRKRELVEPKQETLEEVSEMHFEWTKDDETLTCKDHFISGAKWQQERDKDKYSEEKIDKILQKLEEIKIMINIR